MERKEYQTLYEQEDSHWWYVGLRKLVFTFLHKFVPPKESVRILDAGCGTGGLLNGLRHYKAYGLDISAEAMRFCKLRKLDNIINASLGDIPFRDNSFDFVISLDVLYHLGVKDDMKALGEFNRVLSAGGLLLLNLPAYDSLRGHHDQAVHTRHRYTFKELEQKSQKAGFNIEKMTYRNTILFPLAAAKRYLEKLSSGGTKDVKSDLAVLPGSLNKFFTNILFFENLLLSGINFPFGLSIFALLRKDKIV